MKAKELTATVLTHIVMSVGYAAFLFLILAAFDKLLSLILSLPTDFTFVAILVAFSTLYMNYSAIKEKWWSK